MRTDSDLCQVIDPDILPYPRIIANYEAPRELHADMRLDCHAATDLGSEESEYEHSMSGARQPRVQEKRLTKQPQRFEPCGSAATKASIVEPIQPHYGRTAGTAPFTHRSR
jgi:hypothetical protein